MPELCLSEQGLDGWAFYTVKSSVVHLTLSTYSQIHKSNIQLILLFHCPRCATYLMLIPERAANCSIWLIYLLIDIEHFNTLGLT